MARITQIKPGVKRPWRRNIYLDGEYWAACDEKTVLRLELAVGQEHEPTELAGKIGDSEVLVYAVDYLARYPATSVRRMREKLKKREVSDQVIEAVIEKCVQMQYLDDENLAVIMIRAGQNQGRSRRQIAAKHYQKGLRTSELPDDIWEQAEWDEKKAMEGALRRVRRKPPEKKVESLIRAGFPHDIVRDSVQAAELPEGEEEESMPPVTWQTREKPELTEEDEQRLQAKMHRLYRKDKDERKAVGWGVRHGLTYAHAQAMWRQGRETPG